MGIASLNPSCWVRQSLQRASRVARSSASRSRRSHRVRLGMAAEIGSICPDLLALRFAQQASRRVQARLYLKIGCPKIGCWQKNREWCDASVRSSSSCRRADRSQTYALRIGQRQTHQSQRAPSEVRQRHFVFLIFGLHQVRYASFV